MFKNVLKHFQLIEHLLRMDRFELVSKKMELELLVANEVMMDDQAKEALLKKLIEIEFESE